MAGKGPAPTPTKILKLRGSWRGNRRDGEPEPEPKLPAPPAYLKAGARREWDRIVKVLEPLQYVSEVDQQMLAAYCQSCADYAAAIKARNEPAIDKAFSRMLRSSCQLGLTPASRTQCRIAKKDKTTDGKVGLGQAG